MTKEEMFNEWWEQAQHTLTGDIDSARREFDRAVEIAMREFMSYIDEQIVAHERGDMMSLAESIHGKGAFLQMKSMINS